MNDNVFVDTNVLVYARDTSEAQKHEQALGWMRHLWNNRSGRLSFQALHEFYVTVTDKLKPGLDISVARNDVRSLIAWQPISMDERVIDLLVIGDFAQRFFDRIGLTLDMTDLPIEPLVYTSAELEGMKASGNPSIAEVLKTAVRLA